MWEQSTPFGLTISMENIRLRIDIILGDQSTADQALLLSIKDNMTPDQIAHALQPRDLARLSTPDNPNLGRDLMTGSDGFGVYTLR